MKVQWQVTAFEPIKPQFPDGKYAFEDWAGWLTQMGVLSFNEGMYAITPLGKDFLVYLAETGLTESKPL